MRPRNRKIEAGALANVFRCIQSNADADLIRTPVIGLSGTPQGLFKIFVTLEIRELVSRLDNDGD